MAIKATSLSAQLKSLQVPQSNLLSAVADRRRVSFLYDTKEAANLDSETVYCLAMNGLEELKSIDPETFQQFEETLFSSMSITFERAVQTKQANETLNMEIRKFLVHLSPYFMLKPAHKAFEWLVYRYQIHLYNVNDMFMCVLPYHETNYFVRALQMLNLENRNGSVGVSLWTWLIDNQKQGVPLASSSLATHLYSDFSFLNFIIEYLNECLDEFGDESRVSSLSQERNLKNGLNFSISFFTKIFLQAIKQLAAATAPESDRKNSSLKKQESFLAQLVPVLFDGFKSPIIPFKQSAYLISSILNEKFRFNRETTVKTLFAIAKGLSTFRIDRIEDDADETSGDRTLEESLARFYSVESVDCIKSALLTICLITQSQQLDETELDTLKKNGQDLNVVEESEKSLLMSKSFMKKFMKNFNQPEQLGLFVETIDQLNQSYQIDRYLKCLFARLINDLIEFDKSNKEAPSKIELDLDMNNDENELRQKAHNPVAKLMIDLVSALNLTKTPRLVEFLIDYSFEALVSTMVNASSKGLDLSNLIVEYHLCELISKLESKYPSEFDKCLSKLLSSNNQGTLSARYLEDAQQRNYFLTTISCKFNSFKCKSTFKYQILPIKQLAKSAQQKAELAAELANGGNQEFNLVVALNHANEAIRANGLTHILNELKAREASTGKRAIDLDDDFIRAQLELKFANEGCPLVVKSLLGFNTRLLRYIELEKLIGDDKYLLKFFNAPSFSDDQDSEEIKACIARQNEELFDCRQSVIELVFGDLYAKNSERKELFFNCLLVMAGKLFEIRSIDLLNGLKKTQFFTDMVNESASTDNSPTTTPPKSYPTKSSITISKINKLPAAFTNGNGVVPNGNGKVALNESADDSDALNDAFDQLMNASVNYMLAASKKLNKGVVKAPQCFEALFAQLKSGARRPVEFLDFIVFEICLRVSNQSLFAQNTAYYLSLATKFLTSELLSPDNIKLKKTKSKDLANQEQQEASGSHVLAATYGQIVRKQAIKSGFTLSGLHQSLLKSITIQMSNFVNSNMRAEIEDILSELYLFLCLKSQQDHIYPHIIQKLMHAHCFYFHQTPANQIQASTVPVAKGAVNHQFFNFAFKFLIGQADEDANNNDSLSLVQSRTIRLFNSNIKEVLKNDKRHEGSMANSLVLALTWCLTSPSQEVRVEALDLLESINAEGAESEGDSFIWSNYIRKLAKHREEIQVDRVDYLSSKCLSKILNNDSEEVKKILDTVKQLLTTFSSAHDSNTKVQRQLFFFSCSSDASASKLLGDFKYALLDLFKLVKDDVKLKVLDSVFALFSANLSDLAKIKDEKERVQAVKTNEIIIRNYFLTKKSAGFFNTELKSFKALIAFLNDSFKQQTESDEEKLQDSKLKLAEVFVETLSAQSHKINFFQQLSFDNQLDLLKCFLEMWLSKSFTWSVSIADESSDSNSARKCLLTFDLTPKHYFHLFAERASLKLKAQAEAQPATAKEMKKQMLQAKQASSNAQATGPESSINWKYLKSIVELIQLNLINIESKLEMETGERCQEAQQKAQSAEQMIELIPYLFLVLQTIEKTTPVSAEEDSIDFNLNEYLEIVCLNSLMLIYKLNSNDQSRAKLVQASFEIELLMRMLQVNRKTGSSDLDKEELIIKDGKSQENVIRHLENNFNVQEHILLLLSQVAPLIPDKVLEHVLIMFVFVGNKLARKDDSYSFQIISQTIKTILPAIVNSSHLNNQSNDEIMDVTTPSPGNAQALAPAPSNRLSKTVNIMQRHQKQLPYVSSLVCKILQSFVVSLPHIPAHRKTIIFNQLLQIIGLNDYLWITIIQSIDHYLVKSNDLLDFTNYLEQMTSKQQQQLTNLTETKKIGERKVRDTLKVCIQSMVSLHVQFEPTQLVKACIYLTTFLSKYMTSLFDKALKLTSQQNASKQAIASTKPIYSHLACQLDDYNILQMKYLAYNLLTFVNDLLASEELMTKLVELYEEKQKFASAKNEIENSDNDYSVLFQTLLEKILLLILKLGQVFNQFEHQQQLQSNMTPANQIIIADIRKFHKALLSKSYDLMERTISLLDTNQFINVIRYLIKHEHMQIRRRVLNLLNNKLRKYEPSSQETTLLIGMIDDLLNSMILTKKPVASPDVIVIEKMETSSEAESLNKDISPQDIEIHNQTILFSIKLLCKRIGEQNPLAFAKVIKFLSENLIDKELFFYKAANCPHDQATTSSFSIRNGPLLSSLLLCIGELFLKLKSNALVYLNQVMTFAFDIIDTINSKAMANNEIILEEDLFIDEFESKSSLNFKCNELLMLSSVTCLLKIVQTMSNFLSPYLPKLLFLSCSLSQMFESLNSVSMFAAEKEETEQAQVKASAHHTMIVARLGTLRTSLATLIPLRLLVPIFNEQSLSIASEDLFASKKDEDGEKSDNTPKMKLKHVEYYMQIAKMALQKATQEDILDNIRILRGMFINLFDLRTHYDRQFKMLRKKASKSAKKNNSLQNNLVKYLSNYENHVIEAFCELTFKISEELFRPIYFKMYEWSTANEPPKDRLITFYRTSFNLSSKLRTLFVLFAQHFLQNAASLLDLLNRSKTDERFFSASSSVSTSIANEKECSLLYNIIDTLSNVFLNDVQKTIIAKDGFNLLMQPLVDQIDNEIEFDDYKTFINKHLAPCIANLGVLSAHDETLCRKFNYQILLKTKSDSSQVRLAALDVLNVFSKKLGDVYNSFLSETAPFLSELMEDPVDDVEEKAQFVIKELEDMLGESLQSHFV